MPYRYAKDRPALPAGYQFGDMALRDEDIYLRTFIAAARQMCEADEPQRHRAFTLNEFAPDRWRAPHENDAEQLRRQAQRTSNEAV